MHKSDSISNLAVALAKAQAELPAVKENSVNPFLKSRFADLGAVIQTARPILAKHDLAISQFAVGDGERIGVETMILHASGEWMADVLYLPLEEEKGKSRAQAAGSIVTYLRRYALSAVLGMYSGEDTDGHIPPVAKPVQTIKPVAQEFADEQAPFDLKAALIEETRQRLERHNQNVAPSPLPEIKPLPPPVSIPSKENGGNGESEIKHPRALVKTAQWQDLLKRAVAAGYVPDDARAGFRLTQVVGNYGIPEITEATLNDAWGALQDHYSAKKELETAPAV